MRTAFEHMKFEITSEGYFSIELLLDREDGVVIDFDQEGHPYGALWTVGQPTEWAGWEGERGRD